MMRQFQVVEPTAVAPVPTSTGVRLGPSYPNPTTGPVHLVFSLSKPARVSAEIEDVGGRHVATSRGAGASKAALTSWFGTGASPAAHRPRRASTSIAWSSTVDPRAARRLVIFR